MRLALLFLHIAALISAVDAIFWRLMFKAAAERLPRIERPRLLPTLKVAGQGTGLLVRGFAT